MVEENAIEYLKDRNITYAIYRGRNSNISLDLEKHNVRVFNNSFTNKIANDKYLTYLFANEHGFKTIESNKIPFAKAHFPQIMKSTSGHGGSEVFLIRDKNEQEKIVKDYPNKTFIYQDFVENDGDLRVYLIGQKVIAGVLRQNKQEFRHNYSLGGKVCLVEADEQTRKTAISLAKLLKSDFIGIDFLKTKDGAFLLSEIEDPVGSRMLYSLSNIDILGIFINYLKQTMRRI